MTNEEVLQRGGFWPQEAQEELAEIALEIDARLQGGAYHATPDELAGIDRGLQAAQERGASPRKSRLGRCSLSAAEHEGQLYRRSAARS